jgi:hypothetical protein
MVADMSDNRIPQVPRSYFRFIGARGGAAGTERQKEAKRKNLIRARAVRVAKLKQQPPPL